MQMEARPNWTSRFCISWTRVVEMRAPEQPRGWPKAMAPPLTLTISGLRPSSRTQATDWAAKASLISTRPKSSSFSPLGSRAFISLRVAATGPMPMMRGSTPAAAPAMMRAMGLRPSSLALSADISTRAEAPSLRPEALPAVVTPSAKMGLSFAIFSRLVSRLGYSSVSNTMGSFLRWGITTGTISSLKRPESMAATARCWLSRAN